MTEPVQYEFYAPWPLFGKKLSNQWGESRQNSEVLAALVQAAGLDLDDPLKRSDLMSWELGQLDFHNRFRFIYDDVNTSLKIQKNTGTEATPIWVTVLAIDYETSLVSVEGNTSGFYLGLNRVELFGLNKIQPDSFYDVSTLYFSSDDGFYFTTGPSGNPVVRLSDRVTGGSGGGSGISNINIVAGDNVFADDKISFNPNTFYLNETSDGSPQVNLENVVLQDTSVPVIGSGGLTLLELRSSSEISPTSGLTGFTLSDASESIFLFFVTGSGVSGLEDTKNFHIYEPGSLTVPGSNTNRFLIIGPGLGKAGFAPPNNVSPVTNQLVLLRDGKIVMGTTSLIHTDYPYKLTAGGSVSGTSFYITDNQGSSVGAKELKVPLFTTTDLDGSFIPKRFESNKLTFDRNDFYISPDSSGEPVVSLAAESGIKIKDVFGNKYVTDDIAFGDDTFYLSSSSYGTPIINLFERSFLVARLASSQLTNVATGDHVKWDQVNFKSVRGTNIRLDTTTTYTTTANAASIGRITLKAGKSYLMMAAIHVLFLGPGSILDFGFTFSDGFEPSTIGGVSVRAEVIPTTYAIINAGIQPFAFAVFPALSVDALVEVRFTNSFAVSGLFSTYTGLFIMEL